MCLLSQRQDEHVDVVWCGQAGDYLNRDLRAIAAQFPTRQPEPDERAHSGQREPRANSARTNRQIVREQRIARGWCIDCIRLADGEYLRCRLCREKSAAKEAHRRTRDQRLGWCNRCHRRPRSQGCGLWCKWCWNARQDAA